MSNINDSDTDLQDAYRRGNDAGNGYAIGTDGQSIRDAAKAEGYSIIRKLDDGSLLCSDGDVLIVVGDANGAWAVAMTADEDVIIEDGIYFLSPESSG